MREVPVLFKVLHLLPSGNMRLTRSATMTASRFSVKSTVRRVPLPETVCETWKARLIVARYNNRFEDDINI